MNEYNALERLREKKNPNSPHLVKSETITQGTGDDTVVMLTLPLKELQKARPGTGQRRSIGFSLAPVEFIADGTTFILSSPWIAINVR